MLAYFAGLIDGEGHLGIKRDGTGVKARNHSPVHQERLSVGSTNRAVLELLMSFFGCGRIYYRRTANGRQEWWVWDVMCRQAVSVIRQLYPYLRIKKPEADLILRLSDSRMTSRIQLTSEQIAYRDSLCDALKALHHHTPSPVTHSAPDGPY